MEGAGEEEGANSAHVLYKALNPELPLRFSFQVSDRLPFPPLNTIIAATNGGNINARDEMPQQTDGKACGVFMMAKILFILNNVGLKDFKSILERALDDDGNITQRCIGYARALLILFLVKRCEALTAMAQRNGGGGARGRAAAAAARAEAGEAAAAGAEGDGTGSADDEDDMILVG